MLKKLPLAIFNGILCSRSKNLYSNMTISRFSPTDGKHIFLQGCAFCLYGKLIYLCYIYVMSNNKLEILKEAKAKEQEYKDMRKAKMDQAKAEPNRSKRFWKICWHLSTFPFSWLWHNLKDWRTMAIFAVVLIVVSCEIWLPYLIGFIVGVDTPTGITLISVASTCWLFWLGPFTPFLPLCITITIGIKALFNKIRFKKLDK